MYVLFVTARRSDIPDNQVAFLEVISLASCNSDRIGLFVSLSRYIMDVIAGFSRDAQALHVACEAAAAAAALVAGLHPRDVSDGPGEPRGSAMSQFASLAQAALDEALAQRTAVGAAPSYGRDASLGSEDAGTKSRRVGPEDSLELNAVANAVDSASPDSDVHQKLTKEEAAGRVVWAAGYVAVSASPIALGQGQGDPVVVLDATTTITRVMNEAFQDVPADASFLPDARLQFQRGCTSALCALVSLNLKEEAVSLMRDMWECRVMVLSSRGYSGPSCLCPLINTLHLYLRKKTWPEDAVATSEALAPSEAAAFKCTHCHAGFLSRNALFRHLRKECTAVPIDPSQPPAPQPPTKTAAAPKKAKKSKRRSVGKSQKLEAPGGQRPPPPPPLLSRAAARVWLGDIPAGLCTSSKIQEILYRVLPNHLPMPYVEKVIRKGYRKRVESTTTISEESPQPDHAASASPALIKDDSMDVDGAGAAVGDVASTCVSDDVRRKSRGPWIGYAFVCFRDQAEAAEAIDTINGAVYNAEYTLRLKWGTPSGEPPTAPLPESRMPSLKPGEDPPLRDRLTPRSFSVARKSAALRNHSLTAGLDESANIDDVLAHYTAHPRTERACSGVELSAELQISLLDELRTVRWPAARSRPNVRSEHYLLLYCNRPNPGFEALAAVVWSILSKYGLRPRPPSLFVFQFC